MVDKVWPWPSFLDDDGEWPWDAARLVPGERPIENHLLAWYVGVQSVMREYGDPRGTRKEALVAAIFYLAEVRDTYENALVMLAAEAQAHGASMAEIGRAMGITRQAAHKRLAGLVNTILADRQAAPEYQAWQEEMVTRLMAYRARRHGGT